MGSKKVDKFTDELDSLLYAYATNITQNIKSLNAESMKKLVAETKKNAPVGDRKKHYKQSITSKITHNDATGSVHTWFVKAPNHRLTHLLEDGHALRNGGRTKAQPFVRPAVEKVVKEYEKQVEEIVKNG